MKLGTHKLTKGMATMQYICSQCGSVVRNVPSSAGLSVPFVWSYDTRDYYRNPDSERPPMSCEEYSMNDALK